MRKWILILVLAASGTGACAADLWDQARQNGELNRKALLFCWRYSQGWLQFSDPNTGLLPHDLKGGAYWNAKDCAADNFPFMTITACMTDRALFDGRMHQILETEQRLCNRVDHLPDDYDFATQTFRTEQPNIDGLIFGAAEYIKDGLIPLTEWLGPSPWSDRMIQLMDDIWKQAYIDTEVGKTPSASHEVAGDLLQALSRMYWMTRNNAYKEHAYQLASYFLDYHLPTKADKLGLDDHGCEVIGGLSETYVIASHKDPDRAAAWRPAMHAMLDRVLEVGRDKTGLLYNHINPVTGKILNEERTDNWGYNYNAFATVAALDNVPRFKDAVMHVLTNLSKNKDYPWEGAKADGFADTLEGGINLINRFPVPEAIDWADYTAQRLFALQRDTGVIEGWYGDGNSARTMIMYAQWKSLGARVEPWRADVRVGAIRDTNGDVLLHVASDWPWQGTLRFDIPRHQEYLNMPADYPRINQFPEWFTVPKTGNYTLDYGKDKPEDVTAETLRAGIPITVAPDKPIALRLYKFE
ncbi:MAG TPA: hypothetical protein PLI09_08750 [Candidatus Hydrogenedentes bacterium]|nr:hypothetical protein [Candidatus Hydrogenedentota bacterium]